MPVKKCGTWYKFGNKWKCYKGKNAKSKAKKQWAAIKISQSKKKK